MFFYNNLCTVRDETRQLIDLSLDKTPSNVTNFLLHYSVITCVRHKLPVFTTSFCISLCLPLTHILLKSKFLSLALKRTLSLYIPFGLRPLLHSVHLVILLLISVSLVVYVSGTPPSYRFYNTLVVPQAVPVLFTGTSYPPPYISIHEPLVSRTLNPGIFSTISPET